jgi:hypothetical protein
LGEKELPKVAEKRRKAEKRKASQNPHPFRLLRKGWGTRKVKGKGAC